MAKKKLEKEADKKDVCEMNKDCACRFVSLKIAVISFTLFMVTVWPGLKNWLVNVPWWVYLIIFVAFGAYAMKKECWCHKK